MRLVGGGLLLAICAYPSSLSAQEIDGAESEATLREPGAVVEATEEPDDAEVTSAAPVEESPAARLSNWSAPPSCISIDELRRRVDTQIASEPTVVREVRGEMLRGPAGWIATLTVYESDHRLGERLLQLNSGDCRTHDETLALVIALLLEHGPPPPPEPEPPPPEPEQPEVAESPAAPASEEAEEVPPSSAQPRVRVRGGVGWRAISGWQPSLGWGPSAFLGAEILQRGALDLSGDYYLPGESAERAGGTARTSGGRVHLRGCGLPKWGHWGLSLCAGFGWIGLSASGRGVPTSQAAFHGSPEASGSGALVLELGPHLGLEAGAELMAPFRRGRFVFESAGKEVLVHDTQPIVFASHVGVVLTL